MSPKSGRRDLAEPIASEGLPVTASLFPPLNSLPVIDSRLRSCREAQREAVAQRDQEGVDAACALIDQLLDQRIRATA